MHSQKPAMAERWEKETPSEAALPEHTAKKGKIKKAEPGPPKGVSVKEWDRILQRGPGKIKKAEFPNAAGPEDWDAIGDSPWKQGEPKLTKEKATDGKKEKVSGGDPFDGDGSALGPDLRRIHKLGSGSYPMDAEEMGEAADEQAAMDMAGLPIPTQGRISPALARALFVMRPQQRVQQIQEALMEEELMRRALGKLGHVVPREKLAQGEFEYADLGPNAGEGAPHVTFKMPGKLKRSSGLDQEQNLDEPQRGTEPPAAFQQPPDIRLQQLARKQGPIKKIARASYVALLDELGKLGHLVDHYTRKEAP